MPTMRRDKSKTAGEAEAIQEVAGRTGRGDSLIVEEIPLKQIVENPYQMRETIEEEPLKLLAKSIRERGLFNPITVLKDGDKFIIVNGHRRYNAFKRLHLKTIPAVVKVRKSRQREDLIVDLIHENLIREDLTPLEKAKSIHLLLSQIESTSGDVETILSLINAVKLYKTRGPPKQRRSKTRFNTDDVFECMKLLKTLGLSENRVIDYLTILKLPKPMQQTVAFGPDKHGSMNISKAYQLCRVVDDEYRKLLFEKCITGTPTKVIQSLVDHHINQVNRGEWKGIEKTTSSTWKSMKSDDRLIEISTSCRRLAKNLNSWKVTKLWDLYTRLNKDLFVASMLELKKELRLLDVAIDRRLKEKGYVSVEKKPGNNLFEVAIHHNQKKHHARCTIPMRVINSLKVQDGEIVQAKIVGIKPRKQPQSAGGAA